MLNFIKPVKVAAFCAIVALGVSRAAWVGAQPPEAAPWRNFTEPSRNMMYAAQAKAKQLNRSEIGTEFLLWALLSDKDHSASKMLIRLKVPVDAIRLQAEAEMLWDDEPQPQNEAPSSSAQKPKFSAGFQRVLRFAAEEAQKRPGAVKEVGSEHLLLGLLREKEDLPFSYMILRKSGVTQERIRQQLGGYPG
jgi:ATP-dependent Clp protease ATP-binding subunit ClpA